MTCSVFGSVEIKRPAQFDAGEQQVGKAGDVVLLRGEVLGLVLVQFEAGAEAAGELDAGAIEDALESSRFWLWVR
jgi:hypothetical protein